jgi:cytidylate kinase
VPAGSVFQATTRGRDGNLNGRRKYLNSRATQDAHLDRSLNGETMVEQDRVLESRSAGNDTEV